jgi:hypothetical protein
METDLSMRDYDVEETRSSNEYEDVKKGEIERSEVTRSCAYCRKPIHSDWLSPHVIWEVQLTFHHHTAPAPLLQEPTINHSQIRKQAFET